MGTLPRRRYRRRRAQEGPAFWIRWNPRRRRSAAKVAHRSRGRQPRVSLTAVTASNPGSPPAPESLLPAAWYALAARLLRRSRERWWIVGAYSLVGALVAGGTTFLLPRSFTASAAFQAE